MNPLRVVLVSRRFWPMIGGPEKNIANLGAELASRGHEVIILTARWQPSWPADSTYRGMRLVRLGTAPRDNLGLIRYVRSVASWLRKNRQGIDVVCVSRLRQEAYAAIRAVGGRAPVVLRAESAGRSGDCAWQRQAPCGWRIRRRCKTAGAIIAPTRSIERELLADGYAPDRVRRIAAGAPPGPPGGQSAKSDARASLAELNPSLKLPLDAPLALYAGRLQRSRGLPELVSAWQIVDRRHPDARLWLVGQGRCQRAIEDQIEESGLLGRIVVAGVFDHVDEILAAGDLFVQPATEGGISMAILEAMAAGLPVVAADAPDHRDLIQDGREGLLVRGPTGPRLAEAIMQLLDDATLARSLGEAARRRATEEFSLAQQADDHLRLFESLVS